MHSNLPVGNGAVSISVSNVDQRLQGTIQKALYLGMQGTFDVHEIGTTIIRAVKISHALRRTCFKRGMTCLSLEDGQDVIIDHQTE